MRTLLAILAGRPFGTVTEGGLTDVVIINQPKEPRVTEIRYHDRHGAYIHAVAGTLAAAGFPNDGGNADANDPRDGFVDLDLERLGTIDGKPLWPGAQEVAVCWQEERGWWLLTVADPTSNDGRFIYDLGVATIASPSSVAVAVAEQAGLNIAVPDDDGHPDAEFPEHEFDTEDEAFEAALTRYVSS
jgi:hypothetical protein